MGNTISSDRAKYLIENELGNIIPGLEYKFLLNEGSDGTNVCATINNFQGTGKDLDVSIRIIDNMDSIGLKQAVIRTLNTLYKIPSEDIQRMCDDHSIILPAMNKTPTYTNTNSYVNSNTNTGNSGINIQIERPSEEDMEGSMSFNPKRNEDETREIVSVLSPVKKFKSLDIEIETDETTASQEKMNENVVDSPNSVISNDESTNGSNIFSCDNYLIGVFAPHHSNIPRLLGVYESSQAFYIIVDYHPYSLTKIVKTDLTYILSNNESRRRFFFFQLVQTVAFAHKSGFILGNLQPSNLLINEMLWHYYSEFSPLFRSQEIKLRNRKLNENFDRKFGLKAKANSTSNLSPLANNDPFGSNVFSNISFGSDSPNNSFNDKYFYSNKNLFEIPKSNFSTNSTDSILIQWQQGKISNYDYLMFLNQKSGRRRGNCYFHPILPWVIDFKKYKGGWRDLSKTRFRLQKQDEMLDKTYWESNFPHHISEFLSEVSYYIYLSRITDKSKLTKYVRKSFDPNNYPRSMERLYNWTPEEAIPEFYDNPSIFRSIHQDLPDLEIPEWAKSPEDFIIKHRECLESVEVSKYLHNWIDLVFGFKLTGKAAVEAKNVMLSSRYSTDRIFPEKPGFVQLFFDPHPPRTCAYFPNLYKDQPLLQSWFVEKDDNIEEDLSISDDYASVLSNGDSDTITHEVEENNDPSYLLYIDIARAYERSFEFSQKYFDEPAYYLRKYISNQKHEDLFSLGAILYELYTFRPLFTDRSLQLYLNDDYFPDLQQIPFPARGIVKVLISKDVEIRKKFMTIPSSKQYFPSYFNYAYWFLSQFYSYNTYSKMIDFMIQETSKLLHISLDGFEILMSHILYALINSDDSFILLLKYLTDMNNIRNRILSLSKESFVHKQLREKFSTYYLHCNNQKLLLLLFSYKITHLTCYLFGKESHTFLSTILSSHLDSLFHSSFEISTEASRTLCQISKNELGAVLSFSCIIQETLNRIQRGDKKNPQRNRIALYFLMILAKMHHPSVCLSYYTSSFLKIIQTYLKNGDPDGDLINLLALLDRLLQDVSAVNIFDTLVTNNIQSFINLLMESNSLSSSCFDRLAGVMSFLLQQCSLQIRLNAFSLMNNVLKFYFGCNVALDEKLKSLYQTTSTETSQPKKSSKLWKITSVMKRITSSNPDTLSPINDNFPTENIFTNNESESTNSNDFDADQIAFPKHLLKKSSILYKNLCRIVGNSFMTTTIKTAKIFEDYLQKQAETIFQPDSQEFMSEVSVVDINLVTEEDSPSKLELNENEEYRDYLKEDFSSPKEYQPNQDNDSDEEQYEAFDQLEGLETDHLENMAKSKVVSSLLQKRNHERWWLASKPGTLKRLTSQRYEWKFQSILEHQLTLPAKSHNRSFPHLPLTNSSPSGLVSRNSGSSVNVKQKRSLAVHPRDERIVISSNSIQNNHFLTCWNIDDTVPKHYLDESVHRSQIIHADFLNERVCVSSSDGKIHLWDVHQGKYMYSLFGSRKGSSASTISTGIFDIDRESSFIATTTQESTIRFYDPRIKRQVYEWRVWSQPSQSDSISTLKFDHSIRKLCVGTSNGECYLLDISTGIISETFKSNSNERPIRNFGSLHDDVLLTHDYGSKGSSIKMWDTATKSTCVNLFTSPNTDSQFIDMDCNSELDVVFAITSSGSICYNGLSDLFYKVKRARHYGYESSIPVSIAMETFYPRSSTNFACLKILPLLQFVLVLDLEGNIKIFK